MNPRKFIHEDDVVVHAAPTKEALHAAAKQVYERAKLTVAANDADWTDSDGVVHERLYRFVFGVAHEDITVKQRGFLHAAVFPQIAEQYTFPGGERFVAKVWKEHFRERFLGHRFEMRAVPRWDAKAGVMFLPKRKTPFRVRVSTEDLSIKQYSEYIDLVINTAALELGVVFEFDQQEREAVRWKPRPRKAAAPATPPTPVEETA